MPIQDSVLQRNTEAGSRNHCTTYCEQVSVALVIRRAERVGRLILSSVASIHIFPHHLINGTIFGDKKVTEHELCVSILSTMFL